MNKLFKQVSACVTAISLLLLYLELQYSFLSSWIPHPQPQDAWCTGQKASDPNGTKLILAWTKFFSYQLTDILKSSMGNCPLNCTFTSERQLLAQADAVMFHIHNTRWSDVPGCRFPNQPFVYMNFESPASSGRTVQPGFFNWTATYRLDSTVPFPYGRFLKNSQTQIDNWTANSKKMKETLQGKTHLVAWFVSNCHTPSRREDFVAELGKHIPIDQFGACKNPNPNSQIRIRDCPPEKWGECNQLLTRRYKFYLALENNVCRDYVTEKVFDKMQLPIVPIVFCRQCAKGILPNGSFIAVDDFSNAKELANYLKFLDQNFDEYWKYFQWKRLLMAVRSTSFACDLCSKLNQFQNWDVDMSVKDVQKWMHEDNGCLSNYGLKWT